MTKLLEDMSPACCEFQDEATRNLTITQVQVDESWAFIGAKQKNVPADADPTLGLGDCCTYTGMDPVTKILGELDARATATLGRRPEHHSWRRPAAMAAWSALVKC